MLVKSDRVVCLCLAPIVKAERIYMLTEVAVLKPQVCVISPGACDEAAALTYAISRGKSAISGNEAHLNVGGSGGSENIALLNADKLAGVEICGRTAEDKVDAALYDAILKMEGSPFTLGKLLRPDETAGNYFLIGQRCEEEGVLMSAENTALQRNAVAVKIEGNCLAYVPAPPCSIFKDAVLEADIIAIHKNGIAAEGATLRAVGHILPGVMRTAEGFVFYCKVAFADMYLGHNGTLLYKYIISIKKL